MKRARFLATGLAAGMLLHAGPALAEGMYDVDDGREPDDAVDPASEPTAAQIDAMGSQRPAVVPAGAATVRIRLPDGANPSAYRGSVAMVSDGGGRYLVNTVPLEEYLAGVVPLEMPPAWPAAALAAQAIVARTYALGRLKPARPYDMTAGTADQMYGGIAAETQTTSAVIAQTNGVVTTYNGARAEVAYMSCCGGHTEDAANVWGRSFAYLGGVADPYCAADPNRAWSAELPWQSLARLATGVDEPDRVELVGTTVSGRPTALRFYSGGIASDVEAVRIRENFSGRVPSAYFTSVSFDRDNAVIALSGVGRGHGVGLCQWGARGLAETGADAARIAAFYFPGTAIGRLPV